MIAAARDDGRFMRRAEDQRGLVGKALVILLLLILAFGVAAVDAGSVLFTKFQLSGISQAAATAGAGEFEDTHDSNAARRAAEKATHDRDDGARVTRFTVQTGGVVVVTVSKRATTLVVQRVSFLKKLGIVRSTSSSGPPTI